MDEITFGDSIKFMTPFKPFSENIIFYDTEFSSQDPYIGEILSIGAVKMNGEEFYCEVEYEGEYSDWVKENLLDTLTGQKLTRAEAVESLQSFIGSDCPYMVCHGNGSDVVYTRKLSGLNDLGFHEVVIDFAAILFGLGYDPSIFRNNDFTELANMLGVPATVGHNHNALDDAKFLREVYIALENKN